jgi:hypothetical protein
VTASAFGPVHVSLTFSDLDGRTNAGKYVNSIKNDLEAQIGNPSPGQQILIKLRCSVFPGTTQVGLRLVV